MEDLREAAANAETALSDLRLALHRNRTEAPAEQMVDLRNKVEVVQDMVVDILDNLADGREPFDKV